MSAVKYYRDPHLPVFEIKSCLAGLHASRRHAHEEFSVGLVIQGSSNVSGMDRNFTVQAGSIITIPPGVVHQCNPVDLSRWQFQMLYLKSDWVQSLFDTPLRELPISVRSLSDKDYPRMMHFFERLRSDSEFLAKESDLITGLDYFLNFEPCFQLPSDGLLSHNGALQRVRQYLAANYLEKISLDDLARVAGLSKYYLLRYFTKVYRTSPHAYQTMLRVNHAKIELLKRRDQPITMIAQDAGFYDQSHFEKVFKQYSGTTPLDYRLGQ